MARQRSAGSRRRAGSLARRVATRLHRSACDERGTATVETALVIPLLAVVALLLAWVVSLGATAATLGDIARDAARAVARGESPDPMLARDDVQAQVLLDGDVVTVVVAREVRAPVIGGSIRIEQRATALAETGALW